MRLHAAPSGRSARPTAIAGAFLLLLTACSGSREPIAEAVVTAPAPDTTLAPPISPPTTPPTTSPPTLPATTLAPSSTTSTTTSTAAPTTTTTEPPVTIALEHGDDAPGEPIDPPLDAYAQEPVIELGTIKIPKIGVDMTMYEGIRLTTLDYGPGHWPGTAAPGEDGNVVVGGHRTSKHRVFRNVDQLAPGDEIIFSDEAGEHVYHVDRVEIVEPTAVWIVDPTETPTATLFACHPPGSTAQRIVVFADLADA